MDFEGPVLFPLVVFVAGDRSSLQPLCFLESFFGQRGP